RCLLDDSQSCRYRATRCGQFNRRPRLPARDHVVIAEADRRAASVRSTNTAAVAATRAAPSAIKVICQPAMPPAGAGTGAAGTPPPAGATLIAQAAGAMVVDASRAKVKAASAAARRPRRAV